MAIISVMTTAGETLRAQNVALGTTSQTTRIEADMGHVTTAALAMALTDVVTPFVPVRETTNPQGRALPNDPVAQFRYLDAAAVNYDITGFGIFAGATMTHYICDDAGAAIYQKTAGLILDVILYITARSGDQATFTFSDDLTAPVGTEAVPGLVRLATLAEAQAIIAHSPQGVLSVLRGWQQVGAWWTALTIAASKIPGLDAGKIISGMLAFARLPAATQTEAVRGDATDNDSVMSPYRTRQAIEALTPGADFQTFNASGTWVKPAGAKSVQIVLWNGGHNGSSTNGGIGGGCHVATIPADLVPASVPVTVAGGGGGLSQFGDASTGMRQGSDSRDGGAFVYDPGATVTLRDIGYLTGGTGGGAITGFFIGGGAAGNPFQRGATEVTQNPAAGAWGGGSSGGDGGNGEVPGGGGGRGGMGARGRVIVVTHF